MEECKMNNHKGIAAIVLILVQLLLMNSCSNSTGNDDSSEVEVICKCDVSGMDTSACDTSVVDTSTGESPVHGTSEVVFSRNLDAQALSKGTILYTQQFLAHATDGSAYSYTDPDDGVTVQTIHPTTDDFLVGLHDSKGRDLHIQPGDWITITIIDDAGVEYQNAVRIGDHSATTPDSSKITTLSELLSQVSAAVTAVMGVAPTIGMENGRMSFTPGSGGAAEIATMQINSDNPLSNSLINKTFSIASNPRSHTNYYTDYLLSPAVGDDTMALLFDANGNGLGLETGDNMIMTVTIGGVENVANNALIAGGVQMNSTTLNDILTELRDALKLPYYDGTQDSNLSVSINAPGSEDDLPDGSLVIRSAVGAEFGLENFTFLAENTNGNQTSPSLFNANVATTEYQQAQDSHIFDASISIYDHIGQEYVLIMYFVHTGNAGVWDWYVDVIGDVELIQGERGSMTFGQNGSVATFSFQDNSTQLVLEPDNGSTLLLIDLDVGGPGDFEGITQFAGETTVSAISQDGAPLEEGDE